MIVANLEMEGDGAYDGMKKAARIAAIRKIAELLKSFWQLVRGGRAMKYVSSVSVDNFDLLICSP